MKGRRKPSEAPRDHPEGRLPEREVSRPNLVANRLWILTTTNTSLVTTLTWTFADLFLALNLDVKTTKVYYIRALAYSGHGLKFFHSSPNLLYQLKEAVSPHG